MERSSISRQTRASFLCRGQPDNDTAQWKRWKQHCCERRFKRRFGREAAEKLVKTKKFFLRIWRENVEWDCYPRASENSKVEVELLETFKGNRCLTSENADRFMSSGHPAATSTPSKGGSSKDVLNRLRGMPNMKQVLQGRDTINKVLEEVPHLKAGYHGLVTISQY